MEAGGSGEDQCHDEVEEKGREGQREDKSLRSTCEIAELRQGEQRAKEKETFALRGTD